MNLGPADPAQVSLLDVPQYQSMSVALGESFGALSADFLDGCGDFSARLAALAGAGDAGAFREVCHEVKGSAALLGFSGISFCAAEWEEISKAGGLPEAAAILARLPELVAATRDRIVVLT